MYMPSSTLAPDKGVCMKQGDSYAYDSAAYKTQNDLKKVRIFTFT